MAAAFKKKHTLEQTGFAVLDNGFKYNNKFYSFNDIVETRIIKSIHELKVVGVGSNYSHSISIVIGIKSGEFLQVTEQPTWTYDSKLNHVQHIERMFSNISKKSWDNRLQKYIKQVNNSGYFEYNGWRLYPDKNMIESIENNKCYYINSINFLKSYGFITIREKNENLILKILRIFFGKKVIINTLIDTDVFFALLKYYFKVSW